MTTVYEKLQANEELRSMLLPLDEFPIPKPFCANRNNVKAIVLGADPSNFSDAGKTNMLATVFDLDNNPNKYFKGPLKSLEAIGVALNEVYVQNLIQNYCKYETGANKQWIVFANYWVDELKQELEELDPTKQTPVLLTAEVLYHFLLNKGQKKHKAADFYNCRVSIPIHQEQNKLQRPLIPFYRYNRGKVNYWLSNPEWDAYTQRVKSVLSHHKADV